MAAELINPQVTLEPDGQVAAVHVDYALPLQAQRAMLDAVNHAFEGKQVKRADRAKVEQQMSHMAQEALLGLEAVGMLKYNQFADAFEWVTPAL